MPRCCATIYDPSNPANVVVYVDVDAPDQAAANSAARAAALAAYTSAKLGQGQGQRDAKQAQAQPDIHIEEKTPPLTKSQIKAL